MNRIGSLLTILVLGSCGGAARVDSNPKQSNGGGNGAVRVTGPNVSAGAGGGASSAGNASDKTEGDAERTRDAGSVSAEDAAPPDGGDISAEDAAPPDQGIVVNLCFWPNALPPEWTSLGDASVSDSTCPNGGSGPFTSGKCRYELIDAAPFDVDIFVSNPPCCYQSKTIRCE